MEDEKGTLKHGILYQKILRLEDFSTVVRALALFKETHEPMKLKDGKSHRKTTNIQLWSIFYTTECYTGIIIDIKIEFVIRLYFVRRILDFILLFYFNFFCILVISFRLLWREVSTRSFSRDLNRDFIDLVISFAFTFPFHHLKVKLFITRKHITSPPSSSKVKITSESF